jgi:hypothetical protein
MQPTDPNQSTQQPQQVTPPNPFSQAVEDPSSQATVAKAMQAAAIQKAQRTKQQNTNYSPANISSALATINPNGKSPQIKVGNALNTNNYSGECLAYVDDQQGNNSSRQPTAFADYQVNAAQGNIMTKGTPPKGSRVYFAPTPDNSAGHIGIATGDGSFTGATTSQGIKTFKISDWERYANQQYIGYAPPGSK